MSNDVFEQCMEVVFDHEGEYSHESHDRLGPTKYGITIGVLSEWRWQKVSIIDVRNLTKEEAEQIYKAKYWNPLKLDLVKDKNIACAIFDQGVNCGITAAAKRTQKVLNEIGIPSKLQVDGKIGPKTLDVLNSVDVKKFLFNFFVASQQYYVDIVVKNNTQIKFLKGWLNRSHDLLALCLLAEEKANA